MSRDFIKDIPEHLRHLYDKPAEPDPQRTYFETLKTQEEAKTHVRKNSKLYALMGEQLLGHVQIDRSLLLNINVLDVRGLLKSLVEEAAMLQAMEWNLERVGSGKVKDVIKIRRGGGDVQDEEVTFHFDYFVHSDPIGEARKVLEEAHRDLHELFGSDELYTYPAWDFAYANKDQYDAFMSARRMLGSLSHPNNPINHSSNQGHYMYFRHVIKMKPLARAMRDIRW